MTQPMQSETRSEIVSDYYVYMVGHIKDATKTDAKHFCQAMKEHMKHHGSDVLRCALEEIG